MRTLNLIQTMCLTQLCFRVDDPDWYLDGSIILSGYRHGLSVVLYNESFTSHLSAEEFRTFMAYRVLWGYAGPPEILVRALETPTDYLLIRGGLSQAFSSEAAQSNTGAFEVQHQ